MTIRFNTGTGAILGLCLFGLLLGAPSAGAQSLTGLWDATVIVDNLDVPFRMELSGTGADVKGAFFNGDERVTSSTGQLENGLLLLTFSEYGTTLKATFTGGQLDGRYDRGERGFYPFQAKRFLPSPSGGGA